MSGSIKLITDAGKVQYSTGKTDQSFNFNSVFDGEAAQEMVFESVAKPLLSSVIKGLINSC